MTTRLFLLIAFVSAIGLCTNAATADSPSSAPYAYVTKVPQSAANDPAAPQIYEIDVNSQQLITPGPLSIRVLTSPNASTVYVHVEGQTFTLPRVDSGRFELASNLPALPPELKGRNYTFEVEAVTPDARHTHADIPISVAP
ncbi:MAG: hypothetical protein JO033_06635 [Acidobacteriaceae bacterium]|nr:hypothetical protein [Acidobacteriaceae bacterium]